MDQMSPEPRTMPTTMATAKTRTPSARARVTRNMLAVACLVRRPKPALHQLVRRIHFSLEIGRDQYEGDKNPADHVADDQLKERQVSRIGNSGSADDRERAGFCGDDGQGERPRRRGLSTEEIGVNGLLFFAKMAAVQSDGNQVCR